MGIPVDPDFQEEFPLKPTQPTRRKSLFPLSNIIRSFRHSSSADNLKVAATSNFGYLRHDTQYTIDKVQYRLALADSRIEIEKKVQEGTIRMLEATEKWDKASKSKQDTIQKLKDCQQKLFLLETAKKRLENMISSPIQPTVSHVESPKATGRLKIKIIEATGLPGKKLSKANEFVTLHIDHLKTLRTKVASSHWNEEFVLQIDKNQDIDICVHEDVDDYNLLGFVWFKTNDLIQDLGNSTEKIGSSYSSLLDYKQIWLDLIPAGRICLSFKVCIRFLLRFRDGKVRFFLVGT